MRSMILTTTALALSLSAAPALAAEVGVAWIGQSGITNSILEAIEARLAEAAPDINLEIAGELADADALGAAITGFEGTKDALVVLRSTGYEYLAAHPTSIPTFIAGGNHPVELGAVDNLESPGGTVTGTSIYIEPEVLFEIFVAIDPTQSNLLMLGDEGHPATALDMETVPAACEALFLTCEVVAVASPEAAVALVNERGGEFSGIVLNATAGVRSGTADIVAAAGDLPVFGYLPAHAEAGALVAAGPNLQTLGTMTADQMVRVLVDGAAISEVPVEFDDNPQIYINEATRERLGVAVPGQIEELAVMVGG